uniref:Uncharacterized protein n=1 Tax=Plectus sambesii TaxID=2011161 RepID=A0A914WIB5_9BILA
MSSNVCFLCASRAVTEPLRTVVNPDDPKMAHFPFLRTTRPPPGVGQPGDEVQACHLCAEMLIEQWQMHNRRNVPPANRQYWIKAWAGREENSAATRTTSPSPAPVVSKSAKAPTPAAEPSNCKTCTMCAQVVGDDCLKINPILLTLVPDFAPRFAPSMLTADAQLCCTCRRNDGLQKVMQLVGSEQASLGSLMYEMLMRQGEGQLPLVALAQANSQSSTSNATSDNL